ncbi:hypothetical protein E2C01_062941 [Portunus trituberculatus]|uniref:Uncharacterized protein n=1 Tax=Portunus trituberculatus TaxID=210409 RepID=A0A5B7HJG7_PORTR|nr:hypothetical protein [Portunus trituberculatus]
MDGQFNLDFNPWKEKQEHEDELRAQELKKNPGSNKFLEKYDRLVGKETGKEAARILEVNKQFGFGMYL